MDVRARVRVRASEGKSNWVIFRDIKRVREGQFEPKCGRNSDVWLERHRFLYVSQLDSDDFCASILCHNYCIIFVF